MATLVMAVPGHDVIGHHSEGLDPVRVLKVFNPSPLTPNKGSTPKGLTLVRAHRSLTRPYKGLFKDLTLGARPPWGLMLWGATSPMKDLDESFPRERAHARPPLGMEELQILPHRAQAWLRRAGGSSQETDSQYFFHITSKVEGGLTHGCWPMSRNTIPPSLSEVKEEGRGSGEANSEGLTPVTITPEPQNEPPNLVRSLVSLGLGWPTRSPHPSSLHLYGWGFFIFIF
ncbi:hypothetical protein CRG98_011468 [Punica granatum]|uniref:Uncharacterized protein n=1 Tax=Punica granatum TaxID=22663 RepID=A0A2I0KI87_PUNGR|nr:hypothetical protein CRG98_011468 [Punica granatum]